MKNSRGLRILDGKKLIGTYVTGAVAHSITKRIALDNEIPLEAIAYSDGRLHLGSEASKIFKNLYPRVLSSNDLLYLEETEGVSVALKSMGIRYYTTPLTNDMRERKYVQLISTDLLAIYLGKLKLSDQVIDKALEPILNTTNALHVNSSLIVHGAKPVDIAGKPLVKVLSRSKVDKQLNNVNLNEPNVKVELNDDSTLSYVKTGTLIRTDLYIAIKTIAAKEKKHMYEIFEEFLLGTGKYDLTSFNYTIERRGE